MRRLKQILNDKQGGCKGKKRREGSLWKEGLEVKKGIFLVSLNYPFIISQMCILEVWHGSSGFSAWGLPRLISRCQQSWFLQEKSGEESKTNFLLFQVVGRICSLRLQNLGSFFLAQPIIQRPPELLIMWSSSFKPQRVESFSCFKYLWLVFLLVA